MAQRWQEGYLYHANSSWHVRYCTTAIVDGKPKRVQRSKRLCDGELPKKAVRKKFSEFMADINDQTPQQQQTADLTVVKFWDETYWPFVQENLKSSTSLGYQQVWLRHLKPHFGNTLLRDYRTSVCSMFLTNLAKKYRPYTIAHIKFLASGIFDHAVATGACETNPIRDAKVLGKMREKGKTGSYTLEEIENVISALIAHPDCQLIMALAFFAGLRKGEIAGLQWGDVDNDYIHIRRNKVRGQITTPKTKKSVRSIPIIQPVRVYLALWRSRNPDGVWMFNKALNTVARKTIIPTLRKAGCEWKGYHAGRRGLGTVLRGLTGNSNAGRDVLGHTTTQVTEQHYEHALPAEALRGMKLLEAKSLSK